ncbi:hypothetical protein LINGRAHAP2_LOCUS11364 [Linum grandiflorum]
MEFLRGGSNIQKHNSFDTQQPPYLQLEIKR